MENKNEEYVAIPISKFIKLTKAATMLEVLLYDAEYCGSGTVQAIKEMAKRMIEGGAEK